MPPISISCLHPQLKRILVFEAKHIEDRKERDAFMGLIEAIANCSGMLIGLEQGATGRSRRRTERPPSKYNQFIGKCIRERPEGQPTPDAMKACAGKWKAMKTS